MNIAISIDIPPGWPDSIAKQIRFAGVNTVNKVAIALQGQTVSDVLPHAFTLRARGAGWWQPKTKLGFNVKFANRRDASPAAVLGTRADWMPLQEQGGTKKRTAGALAIPITARPDPRSVIPSRRKPKKLMQRKEAFVIHTPKFSGMFERIGKQAREIHLVYLLRGSAKVAPHIHWVEEMKRRAPALLASTFSTEFRNSLATAKP